jgi:hypothetical protein
VERRPTLAYVTLRCRGSGPTVIRWPPGNRGADFTGPRHKGFPVTGHLVAGDIGTAGPDLIQIADLIYSDGGFGHPQPIALLRELPGCAVVAIAAGKRECVVRTRAGESVTLSLRGHEGLPGNRALLCGSFVHAWLAAGRRLGALDPADLELAAHVNGTRPRAIGNARISFLFGMSYGDGLPGPGLFADPSSASLRRTSAASGAPIAE